MVANYLTRMRSGAFRLFLCIVICFLVWDTALTLAQTAVGTEIGTERMTEAEIIEAKKKAEAKAKREERRAKARLKQEKIIAGLTFPVDATQRFTVRELRISGNTLISTDALLRDIPAVFNVSDKPLREAESQYLFDFRVLQDIDTRPGEPREVSARTIEGFVQYLLSVYQDKNYAGVYVYVPKEAVRTGALSGDVLPIRIIEASVTDVTVRYYDPDQNEKEKGNLRRSAVEDWSPVEAGRVANKKKLDDFLNLLNLNPDRYVSAAVTRGAVPKSLAVRYDIYEANPWHAFIQVDNAGTKERQWNPRVGVINTNLLGIDDTFTAIFQSAVDSTWNENYSIYGSYDFPILNPRLRLNVYGAHSEFDISPESGIFDFTGRGTFYGGRLRYNLLQKDGWFFDVSGMIEHTRSKVNPSLFTAFLATDIKFWLWGMGVNLHRRDDMSSSSISLDHYSSLGGESGGSDFRMARANSESMFTYYTASAAHSQYLDTDKVHRISGTFRYVEPKDRLVPAKMTTFGGMYTVRGYDEYEVVADGGLLLSLQYEFDVIKRWESKERREGPRQPEEKKPFIRKVAPLIFFDYGRSKVRDPIPGLGEKGHEEMISVGPGTILELGGDFSAGVYYGYPLRATDDTREGKGRLSFVMTKRF
ncbi:MAG: ShlB/FhaC/HecB family hemolysin secretion/activation protein [Planctomycetota bacterium]|jgi:hemolysin activation/secretion protein